MAQGQVWYPISLVVIEEACHNIEQVRQFNTSCCLLCQSNMVMMEVGMAAASRGGGGGGEEKWRNMSV